MKIRKRRRLSSWLATGGLAFALLAIVSSRAPRANSPCPDFHAVPLTGTLIEVRQGNTVISNEQAIGEGVPRTACVTRPAFGNPDSPEVTVADCDFAEFSAHATLVP
jgi:hypothetical protein